MQDLNGNGAPELATIVVDDIDPNVHIRDGATGELIADIAFNTEISFDLEVLPDISGNGAPEIAVFGAQLNTLGRNIQVQIRDSETGLIVQRIWDSNSYEAISMATIPDYSGGFGEPPNDAPEIAILSRHIDDEFHKVSIRDSLTFNTIDNVFTGPKAVGHDLVVLNDTSGNEIPEIGVLGVLKDNDQVRVQALDAESGSVLTNIFLGGVYQPRALMIMPDINGNATDEIVALGVDPATQNVRIQVRDSLNTKKAKRVLYNIWLGNANEAIALELVEDINGNGFADIAVLLKTPDGVGRVRVQDGGDGEFIRNLFFSGVEEPTDLTAVEDYDGNGFGELAVLGEKNGIRHVQVLDSSTGTQLNQIDFPDGE
jgi:hypothetical protein